MDEARIMSEAIKPEHAGEGDALTEDKGVVKKITKEGNGEKPEDGFEVTAHYTGYLMDGTKFDSSKDRGQEFKFTIGEGKFIRLTHYLLIPSDCRTSDQRLGHWFCINVQR